MGRRILGHFATRLTGAQRRAAGAKQPSDTDHRAAPLESEIRAECAALADLLVGKNRRYGNACSEPLRVFSKADALEQLRVRIDDKLSRIARGTALDDDEDTVLDLLGYLMLLRIVKKHTRT